jgi:anaerobic magnesium-protoporphyrin IX monomethyl ester cyclase
VIKKPFLFSTRPETVTEEKINILKKARAPLFVKMGVESGSERILKDICNRTTKVEQVVRAYEILHKHGIESGACFMLGFPFETREDIFRSIELARRIKPNEIMVNIFQPMPGQKLRRLCIDNDFMKEDDKPAFFTETSILRMPQISPEEIENLRRVFVLYATLPESYYSQIELCEKDYENNKKLYRELIELRWSLNK